MQITLNTSHYDAPKEHLIESLGLLPHWVVEYNILGESDLVKYMEKRYTFGLYQFRGEVLEDGVYRSLYEDDDDLHWVAHMSTGDGLVYFYPYGIIALPTDDGYYITRMD